MPRFFDDDLPRINADKIKPMVKMWGGNSSKMRKEECIELIRGGLRNPNAAQEAVAGLKPWERNVLALIKRMGGVIQYRSLKIGILASGLHPQRIYNYRDDLIDALFRRGLLMGIGHSPEYITESYGSGMLYSDARLLAQVEYPEYIPFDIQPVPVSGEILHRRPAAVALDIVGILQAIQNMDGLKLTQNGMVRASDEAKLRKALRWSEEGFEMDGFFFPNPAHAWVSACAYSSLLKQTDGGQLILAETPEHFAQRSFGEQVRILMEGMLRAPTWWETPLKSSYLDSDGKGRRQGRLALVLALSALPLNPNAFFSLKDFDLALYQRIGEDFALDYAPQRPYFFRQTKPEQQKQELTDWQQKTRTDWLKQEFPWFTGAFTTWLYFLGLVELVMDGAHLVGFRLTEIGRATFHPELDSAVAEKPAAETSNQPAWVVQPNFDIIAYLERVSAPQLAFLERHAERTESQRHTAHYRITRESVYRGLESGSTLEDLLKNLQAGSQTELPQNIVVELREWAGQRERMILRRSTRLVEFSSGQALKAGLAQGLTGHVIAERFVLLDSAPPAHGWNTINYAETLPKNLTITETGQISWKPGTKDLMTAAQLTQWAQPNADGNWQLTRESVNAAIKSGKKLSELLMLLNNRLVPNQPTSKYMPPVSALPPLLELALRSWAGAKYTVELEETIVLRCPQEQVFQALITSALIKPLLKGYLQPHLLFVDSEHLEALRQHLGWLGWHISAHLQVISSGNPVRD